MKTMEANAEKMEAQLKSWGKKLDKLSAKAQEAGADAKTDFNTQIDELKIKYGKAEAKLKEYKKAGAGKWDTFKTDMDILWNDLAETFKGLTQ